MTGEAWGQDASAVLPFLMPGERTVWVDKPDPSVIFAPTDIFLVPFTLLWTAFVTAWEVAVVASGSPLIFMLWGVPFVAVGLYMVVGRFVVKRRVRRRTLYVLTNQRAIVLSGRSVRSAAVAPGPSRVQLRRDGLHSTYCFGAAPAYGGIFVGTGWPMAGRYSGDVAFEDITDAAGLQDALRRHAPHSGG